MKSPQTKLLILTLAVLVLILPGGVGTGVVCFGIDGHVAIETADSSCCDNAAGGRGAEDVVRSLALALQFGGSCGPCLDIPVLRGDAMMKTASLSASVDSAAASQQEPGASNEETDKDSVLASTLRPYRTPSPAGRLVALLSPVLQV